MQQLSFIPEPSGTQNFPSFDSSMPTTKYRFILQKKVQVGEAIYIVGNIPQLGQWNVNCALRLECFYFSDWIIDVQIPIDTQIQYKFFVSSFDSHFDQQSLKIKSQNWIGNEKGNNFRMFISQRQAAKISQTRASKHLNVMSFNIRCETKDDKDEFNWAQRKQNCIEVIKENYPSIIGVQQARRHQQPYLYQQLQHLYNYFGSQRDESLKTEEVGIFYDKQRFLLVSSDSKWISESGQKGVPGFGARLPRLYTYVVLEDTYTSEKFVKVLEQSTELKKTQIQRNLMMVMNVHLDHESEQARVKGVEMMAKQVHEMKSIFGNQLTDFFAVGDFNIHEDPQVFQPFSLIEPCLISIRSYFNHLNLRGCCDYKYTFNGFRRNESDVNNPLRVIDHLFMHTQRYRPAEFKVIREMIHKPKNPKHSIVSDHFPIMGVFKPI